MAAHVCSAVSTYCSCQSGTYIVNHHVASGLYVPHIIEPDCLLASTVMAAPHGMALGDSGGERYTFLILREMALDRNSGSRSPVPPGVR